MGENRRVPNRVGGVKISIENEVTGPRVFVVQNSKSSKLHITGGYGQPEMKKTLCGQKVKTPTVFDPRDTAARDGYQDHTKWCVKCMGFLDFEALDQIILFAAIEWPTGTNGQHSVVPHLSRKKPKLKLSPPPPIFRLTKLRMWHHQKSFWIITNNGFSFFNSRGKSCGESRINKRN